jgi:hypothetical protein
MTDMLGHHLNRTVMVSIPSVFDDQHPHSCTLTCVESAGLWLQSDDLANKLLHTRGDKSAVRFFFPFAQIAYLFEPIAAQVHKPASPRHEGPTEGDAGAAKTHGRKKQDR